MDYQKVIIVGNATKDAERRKSKKGNVEYTTFNVGVSESKDRRTYFPITAFGKLGESLTEYITRGRRVLVEGRIKVGDNNRFNVVADSIRLLGAPKGELAKPAKKAK